MTIAMGQRWENLCEDSALALRSRTPSVGVHQLLPQRVVLSDQEVAFQPTFG